MDAEIVRYSRCGELLWNRSLGGLLDDHGYSVAIDGQGYVYLAGATKSWGAGDYDVLLAKYDANGNLQWNITWGDADYQFGMSVAVDASGNIYLGGYIGSGDLFVTKFSPTPAFLWSFRWTSPSTDHFEDMAIDASGNVYIAGWNETMVGFMQWEEDAFLAKINAAGN